MAPRSPRTVTPVVTFMLAGLLAATAISLAAIFLTRKAATDEAIREATTLTDVNGTGVVEPVLEGGLFTGDAGAIQRLDEAVRQRVLGRQFVRIKVWSRDGRILYSDEPRLIGAQFPLDEDDLCVLERGGTEAAVSDLDRSENRFERRYGKLLEVYRPLRTPGGEPVLFEAYLPYKQVNALAHRVWTSFLPALVGGLVLLYVIEIPLAWRLARRLEEGQRQRTHLARMAAQASDIERRRIAADLHDGVVQGLAGSSYTLAAAAERAEAAGLPDVAATLSQAGSDLRRWVRELRTLLVNIAPPKLHEEGLAAALHDLASTASGRGIATTVDVDASLRLPAETEALVFRVAQEAVRNATAHAAPSRLRLAVEDSASGDRTRLEVVDDGRGFDPSRREDARHEGHLGLSLLTALAEDAGGALDVRSAPGQGTHVILEVPA